MAITARLLAALATTLLLMLGVACAGNPQPAPTPVAAPPKTTAVAPAATVHAPAAAQAAPTKPAAPASAQLATAQTTRIGLVTNAGKIDDKSFNQSAWEALQRAQKELGAETKYIETAGQQDYQKNMAQFADAGYDIVVTVGYGLQEDSYIAAKKYPKTKFIGIDQFYVKDDKHPDIPLPNLVGLVFDEDKGGYLAGALAGLMTKSGSIAAVLGTDVAPSIWRFGEGFKAGAKAAKAGTQVTVMYHNDVSFDKAFTDPEWGKTTALSLISKNADVIFGAGGTTGNAALLAAAEKGVYCIGVDTDQYLTMPEAQKVMLSSALKQITSGSYDLIKAARDGKLPTGNFTGKVGLAPLHDLDSQVPAAAKTKLQELEKGLSDGTIKTNVPPARPN